jgi:hypothetical protein
MSETGRRRSTRRATPQAGTPGIEAPIVAVIAPAEPAVEVLDDRTVPIAAGHRGPSLGRSLSGAIVGTLLVAGLAFGAALGSGGVLGPGSDGPKTTKTADGDGAAATESHDWEPDGEPKTEPTDGADATAKPDGEPDGEHPDATKEPVAEPTDKPVVTPKPTQKPEATKPPLEAIALGLTIKESHPFMEWGSCAGLDFDAYKVVRSSNSTVSWPLGEGDTLFAVVEPGGARKAYDGDAPHGSKAWYRVFCVRHTEDGYKVVKASVTKGIEVPDEVAPPPPPDPITLGLETSLQDGGKILLAWSACDVDGFAFYKVLRSTTNDDPSYLPFHDGTEVVAAIGEMGTTQLEVWAPDGGATAWYRVQCIGYSGDQKVLLGESAAAAVTMP